MPELPEVETVRRQLENTLVGREIVSIDIHVPRVVRNDPVDVIKKSSGSRVQSVKRRGKNLIIVLDDGKALLFHLMMSGMILHVPADTPLLEKTQVVFRLDDGSELRFRDLRKFGFVKLVYTQDALQLPEFKKLGPEPLSDEFTLLELQNRLQKRPHAKIKALLLDQTFIAGIGNIYADEALHYARIHPEKQANSLSGHEVERLYEGIRTILLDAIRLGGSSINTYVDTKGVKGTFPEKFEVYGRTNQTCTRCGHKIDKIKVAGRGTHICPKCQKQ